MTNETREIVRDLTEASERGFPCVVAHEDAGGPCGRPATMAVYGLTFCEEHGEECAAGAHEELHQDAQDFFDRFDGEHVVASLTRGCVGPCESGGPRSPPGPCSYPSLGIPTPPHTCPDRCADAGGGAQG